MPYPATLQHLRSTLPRFSAERESYQQQLKITGPAAEPLELLKPNYCGKGGGNSKVR
jgi:hypothetical protein